MSTVLPFVDVERLVVLYMNGRTTAPAVPRALPTGMRAATDLPMPLDPKLPLIQVIAAAGTADNQHTARPRLDVQCFALTREAMWALTAASVEAMRSLAGAEVDGQLIDAVQTVMRPYYLAWSPTVHRSIGTYEIQLRPRTSADG